jgi:hypothetical protein
VLPPFDIHGNWYKASLHTHTTASDGALTPSQVLAWHVEHGYHVLAITDHDRVTYPTEQNLDGALLLLPSAEVSARHGEVEYHVVALGVDAMPVAPGCDPQEAMDAVQAMGGVSFVAHPYWHDHVPADLLALKRLTGIEIFNTGCWLDIQKGHSLVHWDTLLSRGRRVWGLATDDSHWKYPDYGRGWIWIRTNELDSYHVLQAIRQGCFYASMGPEIHTVEYSRRRVWVQCSPVRSIYLIGDGYHCPSAAQSWDGKPLTEARFELHPKQRYFRIEVVDFAFQSAWTNAYFLDGDEC